MRVGDEELLDPVVFLVLRRLLAAAAAPLRPVLREHLALDVAGVRERDDDVGRRDQVLGLEVGGVLLDRAAPGADLGLAELLLQRGELVADDGRDPRRLGRSAFMLGAF